MASWSVSDCTWLSFQAAQLLGLCSQLARHLVTHRALLLRKSRSAALPSSVGGVSKPPASEGSLGE